MQIDETEPTYSAQYRTERTTAATVALARNPRYNAESPDPRPDAVEWRRMAADRPIL